MTAAEKKILDYECRAASPLLEPWFGASPLRAALRDEIEESLDGARSVRPGDPVHDAAEGDRFLIEFEDGHVAAALYQRELHDQVRPHIVLMHHSFSVTDEEAAERLRRSVVNVFPDLGIEQIRFFEFGGDDPPSGPFHVDCQYVAGPVREIASVPLPEKVDGVRAAAPESMDFYETYHGWYEAFWQRRPDLRAAVRVEPFDELRECMEEGNLRLLFMGEQMCGVMAAGRETSFGLIGWHVREKVIAPTYWGRGLAIAGTILLARELPAEPHEVMWGSITRNNGASLGSALHVGRRVIGRIYWIDMP